MKSCTALAATAFALASLPLLAQQPSPATQPNRPAMQSAPQQNPPSAAPAPQDSSAASPAAPTAPLSPVDAELVSKLDSKTAKAGDNVEVRTKSSVKTADGTEIPKGSKLVGHVVGVQASTGGTNSQVTLQFDHIELKGGQSLPVHSQIQSIAPAGGAVSPSGSSAMSGATNAPPASASASPGTNGTANGAAVGQRPAGGAPQGTATGSDPAAAPAGGGPAAGTVVAKTGNIAIQTTSIPGILLANNAPGAQDPRMARASSILLGAKKDIELDGGTQMVVALAATGAQ